MTRPSADPTHEFSPSDDAERDARLAEILGAMADDLASGRAPDVEQRARAHPELAVELRSLWGAMLVADCAAAASRSSSDVGRERLFPEAAATLPRRFGDYELLEEIGRGGMGIVYRARQFSLDRVVALKMIIPGRLDSAADQARFRAEAEAAARLDHPHIVPVFDVGECDGQPYFTMKYVEGTTLARRLIDGPLPPREAAALLAPVARAVQFAHERGLLHRDLKPSNVLIDAAGRPHITDFGLAKRVEGDRHLTLSGAILGTPAYMAPEQAAGGRARIGPTADVYSLGVVLYQTLTGRPPFQAASPVETVLLVLEQEPLPPRLLNAHADRQLEMIALKCLQKPPDLRYQSAAALAGDLEAYLADEPIAARSGVFSQVVARWLRETHHATVLENWGLLWMWHSLALLVVCLLTNYMQWRGVDSPWPYLALWTAGLGAWAAVFWTLRHRAGPVTFVERQIAHLWAGSMISIGLLFFVEMLLGLPVLSLSPVLGLVSGMVFLVKAGILSGAFYAQSLALFATAIVMAELQSREIPLGVTLFGLVAAACFFLPGLKYYRQRLDGEHDTLD